MTNLVEELYDYEVVRRLGIPTMLIVQLTEPTLVLGSSQSPQILKESELGGTAIRRRRGGGGVVLTQPGDLWVDWWIPRQDARWSEDVRKSSVAVGHWWCAALAEYSHATPAVHTGPLEGEEAHRVACFAGRGPGEVFVDGRKAVGLTQWRVREGVFVSTILHAHASTLLLDRLHEVPPGLAQALGHHTIESLRLDDIDGVVSHLQRAGGVWRVRRLLLTA